VLKRLGSTAIDVGFELLIAELASCFMLVSFLVYSSTLKTEATCSSETSGDFGWATRQYTPESITLLYVYVPSSYFYENIQYALK
jgi:hypothetical protein